MKGVIILCVFGVVALSLAKPASKAQYTSKYDGVDIDEIVGNKRIFTSYANCILDQGKCTPDGKELKSHVKEALETDCAKCTEAQRKGSEKVFKHLINNEPEIWEQLKAKYDPTGKHAKRHETELRNAKRS